MNARIPLRNMLAALAVSAAVAGSSWAQEGPEQWLVVVQGEVEAISADQLRLRPRGAALAFTDRPERRVEMISLKEFATAWEPGRTFDGDPPNLSLVDEDRGELGVLEVTAATWQDGALDLRFVVLEGNLPRDGDRIAVTFDTFTREPGGGGYQGD